MAFFGANKDRQNDYRSRLDVIRNPEVNHMSRTRTKIDRGARNKQAGKAAGPRRHKKAYDGAYVAEPRRQKPSGFKLAGAIMAHIHSFVIDMDLTSLYPSIMLLMNLSPETFVGKMLFQKHYDIPMYPFIKFLDKKEKSEYKINANDFFMEVYTGKHWWAMFEIFFHMKSTEEILDYIDENIKDFAA